MFVNLLPSSMHKIQDFFVRIKNIFIVHASLQLILIHDLY